MRAGVLRHKLTIETPTETVGARGGANTTWATHATVWGSITPLGGLEAMRGGAVEGKSTHLIEIRYLSTVTSKMRIKLGSRYFYIAAPPTNVDERSRTMQLECTEKAT